jgi:predicted XRE-type DNA-binding protein
MKYRKSSGNVFLDIGIDEAEAGELVVKADLISLLRKEIARRGISQTDAAKLCGVDQPTMSKVMNGRLDSITIDRLAKWAVCLGYNLEIKVRRMASRKAAAKGSMSVDAG